MGVLRTLAAQYNPLTFSHILAFGLASFHFHRVVSDRRECCASFTTGDWHGIDKNETSSLKIEIRKNWQEITWRFGTYPSRSPGHQYSGSNYTLEQRVDLEEVHAPMRTSIILAPVICAVAPLQSYANVPDTSIPTALEFSMRPTLARGWGRLDLQWGTRKCETVG